MKGCGQGLGRSNARRKEGIRPRMENSEARCGEGVRLVSHVCFQACCVFIHNNPHV